MGNIGPRNLGYRVACSLRTLLHHAYGGTTLLLPAVLLPLRILVRPLCVPYHLQRDKMDPLAKEMGVTEKVLEAPPRPSILHTPGKVCERRDYQRPTRTNDARPKGARPKWISTIED